MEAHTPNARLVAMKANENHSGKWTRWLNSIFMPTKTRMATRLNFR